MAGSLVVLLSLGLAALMCGSSVHAQDMTVRNGTTKPNIIWIMADDMGYGEVGLYPAGSVHGRIATPNLDKFGKEGIMFTNAYAGYTVCAPSRTAFFTGYHSGNFARMKLDGETLPPSNTLPNTAQILKQAGYATAVVGKCAPMLEPTQQGFDFFLGQISQNDCHNMYPEVIDHSPGVGANSTKMDLPLNDKQRSRSLCMAHPNQYNYTIDVFQTTALKWLDTRAGNPTPFFLYLSFTVPHAGGWGDNAAESGAPVPTDLQYAKESWPDVEIDHAAVITYMDNYVGQVLQKLATMGIDNSTLVFFASDNGAHLEGGHDYKFFNSTGGLRGHKRSLYEGGVRSPIMVRWPGTIAPGRVDDYVWTFWDVLPTIADLVGVPAPSGIDGVSILPTLLGTSQPPKDFVYFTWSDAGNGPEGHAIVRAATPSTNNNNTGYGVRAGKYKGVVPTCAAQGNVPSMADVMALYDLDADPFETTDISAKNPSQVNALKQFVVGKGFTCTCYQC